MKISEICKDCSQQSDCCFIDNKLQHRCGVISAYKRGFEDGIGHGWHPVSELPIVPKDEDSVWVYCLVYGKGTDGNVLVPMCVEFTKLGWRLSENIIVKWWCYPPNED